MSGARRMGLHHELLLLALHDDDGTLAFGRMHHVGLAGAIFAELLLAGRVEIVTVRRRRKDRELVEVVDPPGAGRAVTEAALRRLADAKRRASPRDTVLRISRLKDLRHDVGRELARKGILRATEKQVLLFFERRVYPTVDPGPERALVARLRDALENPDSEPDDRTILLVALADATATLRALYSRKESKALEPRIEALAARAGAGADAAAEAVRAAHAAAVAATSAAVTATTAASAAG